MTILNTASDYNLSRNPNYVRVQTNNYTIPVNNGVKAQGVFMGMATNVLDDTMTVDFNGTAIVYTFKNTFNIALKQLSKFPGGDVTAYIAQLVNELNMDPAIANFYEITRLATMIVFTARNPGPQYNLSNSSTSISFLNAYYFDNRFGTNNFTTVIRDNFKIVTELWAETAANSNVFEKVVEIAKEPIVDRIELDLAPFIDNCLAYEFPNALNTIAFLCPQLSKRFYVRNYEYYGTPATQQGLIFTTITYHSLKAGFGRTMNKVVPKNQLQFFYWVHQCFLTRQNRFKKIARHQLEYLYFCFDTNIPNPASIRYTCYDAKGKTTVFVNTTTAPNIKIGNVWAFPVNHELGYLASYPEFIKMEVQVIVPLLNQVLSETFTYYADDEVYQDECFLFFANADGGLDTVRMTGKIEASQEFSIETSNRTLTVKDSMYDGDSLVQVKEKTDTYTAFSGFVDKETISYIEDLFLSRKVFILKRSASGLYQMPIVITTKALVKHKTRQNLFGYQVEYYEAQRSELPDYTYHAF